MINASCTHQVIFVCRDTTVFKNSKFNNKKVRFVFEYDVTLLITNFNIIFFKIQSILS